MTKKGFSLIYGVAMVIVVCDFAIMMLAFKFYSAPWIVSAVSWLVFALHMVLVAALFIAFDKQIKKGCYDEPEKESDEEKET